MHRLLVLTPVASCNSPLNVHRTGHSPPRRRERQHEAIAGALDLLTPVSSHLLADKFVTSTEHLTGGLVTKARREVRGALDIGKEDGDCAFGKLLGH